MAVNADIKKNIYICEFYVKNCVFVFVVKILLDWIC